MQQDEAAAVIAFLRANPDFLAENPGLYDDMAPPLRLHGPAVTDHMAAMLRRARDRAEAATRSIEATAADRRAADGFARRVQEAVLALMRTPDPARLATDELPALLHLDAVRLCSEASPAPAGAAPVARGTVAAALGRRTVLVRPALPDPNLHGEAAALAVQEALVRVPLPGGPALLALAARHAGGLDGATSDSLVFLADAIAAALDPSPA